MSFILPLSHAYALRLLRLSISKANAWPAVLLLTGITKLKHAVSVSARPLTTPLRMPVSVLLRFLIETIRENARLAQLLSFGIASCRNAWHAPTTSFSISAKRGAFALQPCPSLLSITLVWFALQILPGIPSTENV